MSRPVLDHAVLALMADPSTYGLLEGQVDCIETHAATVFLAGERAFKLKKPVNLGFLDFSTVERRAAALDAELRLNRPAAVQLYHDVIWVTRAEDGVLSLGGEGEPVEPVLAMARFDQDALLDQMAQAGRIDGALARDLADAVLDSHARAPVCKSDGARPIRTVLAEAAANCRRAPHAPVAQIDRVFTALDQRFAEQAELLSARANAGFVRRCHGDLHLNNIVLCDGRPILFDALEFDEALATTDTLYDLAFLVMDLVHHDMGRAAAALLSQYAARLEGDLAVKGLALLPAFCGLRALIRALVALDRGEPGDGDQARAYLDLAERCAKPASARLVGIGGLSGTGKSTLAEGLAPRFAPPPGALVIRADLERKALEGVGWRDELPKSAYTREASRRVYDRQRDKARLVLGAGLPVVMDAVHSRPDERVALEQIAKAAGAPFSGLWLQADGRRIRERVSARRDDPSDADLEVVEKQAAYDAGDISWAQLDSSGGPDAVLQAAVRAAGLA